MFLESEKVGTLSQILSSQWQLDYHSNPNAEVVVVHKKHLLLNLKSYCCVNS